MYAAASHVMQRILDVRKEVSKEKQGDALVTLPAYLPMINVPKYLLTYFIATV